MPGLRQMALIVEAMMLAAGARDCIVTCGGKIATL
jgi:hypothetical protein